MKKNAPSRHGAGHPGFVIPAILGGLLVLGFLVLPLVSMLVSSLKSPEGSVPLLGNYLRALTSPFQTRAFQNSLCIALISTLAGLVLGTLSAASLHSLGGKWKDRFSTLAGMTSNFSGVPLAFGYIVLLGANGIVTLLAKNQGWIIFADFDLYTWTGLSLVYVYFQLPLAILLLLPAFGALDPAWKDASRLLGASSRRYWFKVALPVILPALAGTAAMLFANALGAYATAYALTGSNYGLVPIRIGSLIAGDVTLDPGLGGALAVLLCLLMGAALGLNQFFQSRWKRKVS